MAATKDRMTIVFFSGTMDKAMAMLILASTAASMNMDVRVFFTFWGLNFLKKDRDFKKKNLLQKMMEFIMPSNRTKLPLSHMNMFGAGPEMMKRLMSSKRMASLDEMFDLAVEMGAKFYACSTSCGIMGLERDNMTNGVTDVVGATTFLEMAKDSRINLFI
ncbi:MAG: DsrE/DsrF/DrsH-like family protein [Endomicrobiales bacterium]|nr:DsrE/DsrF/DrsH-like family protein [Endomicrobiales bacterium]